MGTESEAMAMSLVAGLSTGVGGSAIFFVNSVSDRMMAFTLALAAGVMTAVSLLELMSPIMEGRLVALLWAIAGAGIYGMLRYLLPEINHATTAGHKREDEEEPLSSHLIERARNWRLAVLMMLTLTAHNLPEGLQ